MRGMIRRCIPAAAIALLGLFAATPAQAELTLCNRTSYRVDAAIGLEKSAVIATRGWFRLDPGECRRVLNETLDADMVYVHTRTPEVYGPGPSPQSGHASLCVGDRDFTIADARACPPTQKVVRFTAIKPSETEKGPTANLAEEADYDDEQARLAGIQRLLVIAGYDAHPIDGVQGAKTETALARFLKDRNLPANAPNQAGFFDTLMKAAENPEGIGFSWCNDTKQTVMASLGIVEMGSIVTRGWYRVEPGKCVRPDVRGDPHRLYSYAEEVDEDGRALTRNGEPVRWGGDVVLCTREGKFELSNHKDCTTRGLKSAGFAAIEVGSQPATTVRFTDQ
ncbi:MAG TPA: DUF1036 domain-containing protein [Pseudolabrys sp.]|jgi:uncharacterized membrane protein|nr:DUF1036 domain-containing protein [Pseudolabrys sp.]